MLMDLRNINPRGYLSDSAPRRVERACRRHMLVLVEVEEPPRKPGEMPRIGLHCPAGHPVHGRADWLEVFVVPEGLVPVPEPKPGAGATKLNGRDSDGRASSINDRWAGAREIGARAKAARTHCRRGHKLVEENIVWRTEPSTGRRSRECRTCRRNTWMAYEAARAAKLKAQAA